ncbi:MAG: bis(5'-nucleosyl)-tetraphosphatase (symmetrical), partial [Candidatus Azotimanducaceae bacterium]
MSTYVVGDIQGCFQELMALLSEAQFVAGADHLWIAGDLINRGPDNLETINYIRQLPNCRMVLG